MHFTCRSFISAPDSINWAQYWENEPDDPFVVSKRGHLFGLISLKSKSENHDLNASGHDIIYEINQNFFSLDGEENLLSRLKNVVSAVLKNPLYFSSEITVFVGVVFNNKLYVVVAGCGKVVLVRGNGIGILLDNDSSESKGISGQIKGEDKIMFLTNSFYEEIGWEKIKKYLSDNQIQNIEENFLSLIYSIGNDNPVSAALIQVHQDEVETEETSVSSPAAVTIVNPYTDKAKNLPQPKSINRQNIFSRLFNKKNVYVSHHDTHSLNKRKRTNLVVAVLLLLTLTGSIYFSVKKEKSKKAETQYQSWKSELNQKIGEITAAKTLDLDLARQKASEAQLLLQNMNKLGIHNQELTQYTSQINFVLSQTGSNDGIKTDVFFDLAQDSQGKFYKQIIFTKNKLYLFDSTKGRIDTLDPEQKSLSGVLAAEKLKDMSHIVISDDNIYTVDNSSVYLLNKSRFDTKISLGNIKPEKFAVWNGAVYILDKNKPMVWKYTPNSTGFGQPQEWIKSSQDFPSNVTDFAISGKIWVLQSDGKVTPFNRGVKENFNMAQSPKFTSTRNLVVGVEDSWVAFVDGDSWVYIYTENGELKAKYNLDKITIADISLDEQNKLIYVLSEDQKIYKINF